MKKLLGIIGIIILCVCVFGAEKTLHFTWEQTITTDFAGWKLYKSETAGGPYDYFTTIDYVEPQTEYTTTQVVTVPDGQTTTLYFVLTAFDDQGNESGYSGEASITLDFEAPPVPITLTITVVTQ